MPPAVRARNVPLTPPRPRTQVRLLLDVGADAGARTLRDENDPKSKVETPLDVAKDPAIKAMLQAALSSAEDGADKDEV